MLDFLRRHRLISAVVVLAAALFVTFVTPDGAYAANEKYEQTADTIRASGGVWQDVIDTAKENADSNDPLFEGINQAAGMTSAQLNGNYVEFKKHPDLTGWFISSAYLLLNPAATGDCSLAITVTEVGVGNLTALTRGANAELNGWSDESCRESLDRLANWFGDIEVTTSITDEELDIPQSNDINHSLGGLLIKDCDSTVLSGQGMASCIISRNAALDALACDGSSSAISAGRCNADFINTVKCLRDNPAYSVAICNGKAQDWLDGDTDDISAGISDDEINEICNALPNIEDRVTCVTNAKAAREALLATDCVANPEIAACEKETSCAIDVVGWIVCGVMRAASWFNDLMYGVVEGILLTAPLQTYQSDGVTPTPQYSVWRAIRDISNVLLVIVFLIIIFSQATSIGISSYGIKKMLPRIVIAAIAINLSYFAMQIAVDAANLIGVGLHNFVGGVADTAFDSANVSWTSVVDEILSGTIAAGVGAGVAGLVISSGAFSATALGLLALPFIAVAVLSLIAAFVTLFLRNAFIIILVIISPLAFAAYLLPNTESLFTRWRKALVSMLILFPTAALLFAGSKLAAYVIMGSRSGLELFFALVIMTMPLFMLPWLARSGGGILKTVGDRLQSMAKSAKSPLQKALKPYVENQQEKYRSGRGGFFTPWNRERALTKKGNAYKTDKNGNAIRDASGKKVQYKKNMTQRWTNARKDLEQQTKNDAERTNLNWQQRAVDNPTGKTGQRIAEKEDLHLRSKAQEDIFKVHEQHRIATPGSNARAYTNQSADAATAMKELQETEKSRQNQRILANKRNTVEPGRLGDQSRAGYAAEQRAKETELDVDHMNKTNNTAADAAIQGQKLRQEQIKAIDVRQQKDYDKKKEIAGSDEYAAAQDQEFSVRESSSSNAVAKAAIDQAAEKDATQILAADRKFAAEQDSAIVESKESSRQEARLGDGGDLQDKADEKASYDGITQGLKDEANARLAAAKSEDDNVEVGMNGVTRARLRYGSRQSAIAKSAQSKAVGHEELTRAKEITDNPNGELAKAMAGMASMEGNIDGISDSTNRVVGAANQAVLKDIQGDEAVAAEEFRQLNMGNNEGMAVLGFDRESGKHFSDMTDGELMGIFPGVTDPRIISDIRDGIIRDDAGNEIARNPGVVRDGDGKVVRSNPDDTDKTTAIRKVASGGDKGANDVLLDVVLEAGIEAEQARADADANPTDPAKRELADKLTKRAKRFQSAAIEEWNKNPSAMPPWVSSEDRDAMARGRLARTKQELIVRGFTKGKYNPANADRWDKDHFRSAATELQAMTPDQIDTMLTSLGGDKTEKAEAFGRMRATLDTLVDDPQYKDKLEEPAKASIAALRTKLDELAAAGVVPIPANYVRVQYIAPGQVMRDENNNPVPYNGP